MLYVLVRKFISLLTLLKEKSGLDKIVYITSFFERDDTSLITEHCFFAISTILCKQNLESNIKRDCLWLNNGMFLFFWETSAFYFNFAGRK